MMKSKFIKLIFGPIHAETRFKPLIKHNKETLKHYVFLVDHPELYEEYKDLAYIVSINDLRKDHAWSNEKEIIYQEKRAPEYIKNFREFYTNQHLTPLSILRLGFKHLMEQDILNVIYLGNNCFMTNKESIILNYFDSIPPGVAHFPHSAYAEKKESAIYIHLGEILKAKFPELKFPETCHPCETYMFGCHFRCKQDMLMFYKIWDFIVEQYYINHRNWFFEPRWISYISRIDDILGYLMEVFKINFGYENKEFLAFWNNSILGWHLTTPHDTFAYGYPLPYRFYNADGSTETKLIPKISETDEINSISDYIKKYKEPLMYYYNCNSSHCNVTLDETNNTIDIVHKNL